MSEIDRRRFLGAAAAATSLSAAAESAETQVHSTASSDSASDSAPPPPMITLGQTGIRTSRLAQGTGVKGHKRQSDQTRMGFEEFVNLFLHAYERGIRFFDLADLYGSHVYFREALRTIPRDEITILTKLWWRYDGPEANTTAAHRTQVTKSNLERFCQELTTDRLDIVLLHCLTDPAWPERMKPYLEAFDEAKEKGRIKAVGVSCHDFGAMKTAVATPWVELILARTNFDGVKMDASPEEVNALLTEAKAAGKSVVGMKIFGEGKLADQRDRCMAYAQSQVYLDAMTIGFHTKEQIDDVLRLMHKHPASTGSI